jgi:DNA recombination protein RmuC
MMAENAQKISDAGQDLHDRVAILIEHLGKMGKSLGSAVDDYNRTVGSLEGRVLPAAKRLKELGAGGSKEIAELPRIEKAPRAPEPTEVPQK